MNINLTLIIQMIVFMLLVLFTMSFIWPPLMRAVEERQKKIAQGLAAADRGEQELQQARQGAEAILLGCTELELLLTANDCTVPLLPSAQLHVQAAVYMALA